MTTINRQILSLALPSIISNITVPLIGLVDIAISGHLGGVAYIGAIAVGSMIFNVTYWLFGFLRMGTSGMTSQALGRRDMAETLRVLARSLMVSVSVAAVMLAAQTAMLAMALLVIAPSADVSPLVARYFNICVWGAPAMMCQYAFTGWFIGMQNTRSPMLIAICQNVVNIMLSMFFVVVMGMKVEGVALGTLLAQWSGLLMAVVIFRVRYLGRLRRHGWSGMFAKGAMGRFFAVNRDIFLRTLFLVAVNLFFVSAGARQGDVILSVNTLLMTMFTIFSYFMDGFAYAAEALCGRCYGARNSSAFHDTSVAMARWGIAMVVLFTVVYAAGGPFLLSLLTDNSGVVDEAVAYLPWVMLVPAAGAAAFIYDGIFIGITATRGMLVSSAVAAVIFFAVFLTFQPSMGNNALWMAFIIYLAMRGMMQAVILKRTIKW